MPDKTSHTLVSCIRVTTPAITIPFCTKIKKWKQVALLRTITDKVPLKNSNWLPLMSHHASCFTRGTAVTVVRPTRKANGNSRWRPKAVGFKMNNGLNFTVASKKSQWMQTYKVSFWRNDFPRFRTAWGLLFFHTIFFADNNVLPREPIPSTHPLLALNLFQFLTRWD